MPFCESCGLQNRDTARFCQRCGQPLAQVLRPAGFLRHAPAVATPLLAIKIIAYLSIIGGSIGSAFAVLFFLALFVAPDELENALEGQATVSMGAATCLFLLALSVAAIVCGIGALRLQTWGYWGLIVLLSVNRLLSVLTIAPPLIRRKPLRGYSLCF